MDDRVVVVGAGIGGLVSAVLLAVAGLRVTVVERAATPGGKMREVAVGGGVAGSGAGREPVFVDAGPTVLTMRWVFDEVFAQAGSSLDAHVSLRRAGILARHAWDGRGALDLFADTARSAEAVGDFAGAPAARGFLEFCCASRRIYDTLEHSFIRGKRPTPLSLVRAAVSGDAGVRRGLADLWAIRPFETMWTALGRYFEDPRLRQLFGRYATYCGSSPFEAPATLMLVAHVEREGVWLVEGGMRRLADALAALAASLGVVFHYGTHVETVVGGAGGDVAGVTLHGGERIAAEAVVLNADPASLAAGLFGDGMRRASAAMPPGARSLSAVTWAVEAETDGFPLVRHTVFFSGDYPREFRELRAGSLPSEPTVYVCAQDRDDAGNVERSGLGQRDAGERLLCLVNAPARGDTSYPSPLEIEACADRSFALLERCGLRVRRSAAASVTTAPREFAALFPATGGALYGPAVHGSMASFRRPGSRTRVPGLYLAGGGTHPGAGVPMAALSGRQAAASVLDDLAGRHSTGRSRGVAMPGGMSMR